jgi:hypothetical protein
MKKIVFMFLILGFTSNAWADQTITFTFTDKQILIAKAAKKKIHKDTLSVKQMIKRDIVDIIGGYKIQLKGIKNNAMTDQEEIDTFSGYTSN